MVMTMDARSILRGCFSSESKAALDSLYERWVGNRCHWSAARNIETVAASDAALLCLGEQRIIIPLRLTYHWNRPSVLLVMARLFTSLFLIWALLLGPALCVGGLLEHACECGSEISVECQHEDSCPDDPCAPLVRAEDQDAQANFEFEGPQVIVALLTLDAELASVRWSWSSGPPLPPDCWSLPYAQSNRPQLI